MKHVDVVIIGAGAAGLMCAIEAGKRGRKVLLVDHANKAGKKILMSGGGRCNFTNYSVEADNFLSHNQHFCKSALSRYSQWDFLAKVQQHQIAFQERDHGQLFCEHSAKDLLSMLLRECQEAGAHLQLNTHIESISQQDDGQFLLKTQKQTIQSQSLVVATGGLSIPKMGATPLGYQIAAQFGLKVQPTRAGLVPLTLQPEDKATFAALSGLSTHCTVSNQRQSFTENLLFTHRGLSGPVILQMSSYWREGEPLSVDFLPGTQLHEELTEARNSSGKVKLKNYLGKFLPKQLIAALLPADLLDTSIAELSEQQLQTVNQQLHQWSIKPNGTEGYRTAEVTLGGVDCDQISSKTLEAKTVTGLYFVGEVLDVSGWLGGYNFQWAWASGWCAGQFV